MRKLPPLLYSLMVLLCSNITTAAVFTVTTVANTGAGSLRDALTKAAANGTTETDYIYFSITRAASFVIPVPFTSPLPNLSSNLVIDGTTQPTFPLGVSDAHVTISYEGAFRATDPLILFNLNTVKDIAIYGLFLKANVAGMGGAQPGQLYAICMQAASNITIGAPGKGNLISGWSHAVYDSFNIKLAKSGAIKMQSNILGLAPDGISTDYGGRAGGATANGYGFYTDKNTRITIGGDNANEGNYFNSVVADIFVQGEITPASSDHKVQISNNKFGVDIKDGMIDQASGTAIWIRKLSLAANQAEQPSPYIASNYIGGKLRTTGIILDSVFTAFTIEKNLLGGEDNGLPVRDTYYGAAIVLNDCLSGNIGGASTANGNYIRYWKQGAILLNRTGTIAINHNATYCNRKRSIVISDWPYYNTGPQPFVTINSMLAGIVGTSKPNSTVELFYDDDCDGCEGQTYFATVTADALGNWQFTGTVTSDHIVATATDNLGATSEYSRPQIDAANVTIQPGACGTATGFVCGLKIVSGTAFHWENEAGITVSTDTCLLNALPGKYYLKMTIGTGTCEEVFSFVVPDTSPVIDASNVVITPSRCGISNGAVCGIKIVQGQTWQWEDENGNGFGNDLCLKNVPAGRYRLRVSAAACTLTSPYYEVKNLVPAIDVSAQVITNTTCNRNNGSIKGIKVNQATFATVQWKNDAGTVIGTGNDIANLLPGRYKLVVLDNSGVCGDSTAYITIGATPVPLFNTANVQVVNTTCLLPNGSISNIQVQNGIAPTQYWWTDDNNNIVSTALNLLNTKAGRYRLKYKDAAGCDTLFSPWYDITNTGSVTLDTANVLLHPVGCTGNNGSIKGIKATGADRYEWVNTTSNTVAGNSIDLTGVAPGSYRLTVYNTTYNCAAQTRAYIVQQAVFAPVTVERFVKQDASCNNNNGSIAVQSLSASQSLYTFKWLKNNITVVGNTLSLTNLSPAAYQLVAIDTNGCEQEIFRQAIVMLPLPVMDESNVKIDADTCRFKTGAVRNLLVNSDVAVEYKWYNNTGAVVGTTARLQQVAAGDYYLRATDARGCVVTSGLYTIPAAVATLPPPRYTDQVIGRNTDASLKPVTPGTLPVEWQLFDVPGTATPIAQNKTGQFTIAAVKENKVVYIKTVSGECASDAIAIKITVVDETVLGIPNAFTPNGDGINDEFRIEVTGLLLLKYLKIFNRWGQPVFETRDIRNYFKGTRNGQELPNGIYYYVIEGAGTFNKPVFRTGSVTIIR